MAENEIEIEIEIDVADAIAAELDAGDDATAPAAASNLPMHGGPGSTYSIHSGPGVEPMTGELSTQQHGGAGTRPLGAGYTVAADNAEINEIRAQVKKDQAATAESFRRFERGFVEPHGTVAGLGKPYDERNKQ